MTVTVFDPTPCALGEGALWHPERGQLFWFDILGKRLLTRSGDGARHWQFDEHVSAAGWIDRDTLLVASETALSRFDLTTGETAKVIALEADTPTTRSNDGRADPLGGFWIGTMNKDGSEGGGAIYRFFRGDLRRLYAPVSIPNAICFAPDGSRAYFADTARQAILCVALDPEGWPAADPETFADLSAEGLNPDGTVTDRDGCLWNAQWGAARVARYGPDGRFLDAVSLPAQQTTCPAFGEDGRLYCTSAADGLPEGPDEGCTFTFETDARGWPEPRVIL
ncbi:SMP-30/gluconolactonase/LRE family protein [Oceaniglobus roseus]|uniref:SMP-30/gluconolactonase/LRE family protein n=1 Tax=Oceaniglobus roseus TaxID=1737570 RepID=UPI000C7F55C5|nr:SMP-30/gluconolactonase/LRE family protein [Kandeliimicrobium roseum]